MKTKTVFLTAILSACSFAFADGRIDSTVESMLKYEAECQTLVLPQSGIYTLKDKNSSEKMMVDLTKKPFIEFNVHYYPNGAGTQEKYLVTHSAEETKKVLTDLLAKGITHNGYNPSLVIPVEVDGIKNNLSCQKNNSTDPKYQYAYSCSVAYYSGAVPGLPGFNRLKNRSLFFYFNQLGEFTHPSSIYQAWIRVLKPQTKEMFVEVIDFEPRN